MKRARARASLAVGAVALAALGGAVLGTATDAPAIGSPGLPVGGRSVASDEQHGGAPTDDPIIVGDPHGGGHGDMSSPDPVDPPGAPEGGGHDMSGHDMSGQEVPDASSTPVPASGGAGSATPAPSPGHDDADHDMGGMTHEPASGEAAPSDDPAGSSHGDEAADHGDGGHDEEPVEERPRAVVLGGFAALNSFVFAAAAFVRHRDRNSARAKVRRTRATSTASNPPVPRDSEGSR